MNKNKVKINSTNTITGDNIFLCDFLKFEMKKADEIKLIVSFLMESGIKLIIKDLKKKALSGTSIKILTGTYLGITEPSALYLLKKELGDLVDLRLFSDKSLSFHPKTYIFKEGENGVLFVGSSNISKSALTSGIEWNYRLEKSMSADDFNDFDKEFDKLFDNYSIKIGEEELKNYAKNWKKPRFNKTFELEKIKKDINKEIIYNNNNKSESININEDIQLIEPEPRGAQIEALYELESSREENINKGLVVAATGVGKTYLCAFDSINFKKVLFIAHRKEILKQTEYTFRKVRKDISIGYFNMENKDKDKELILASVQTLGKDEYLNDKFFSKEYFDYIVVDEFHHVAAKSYRKILEYFKPKFLLGLTATPYRMDNKDIFEFCDDNIIYEIDLKDSINRDLLVPFKYYGIYDQTDYNQIDYSNGKYNIKQLENLLSTNSRADLVYKHYVNLGGKRSLGFCTSIKHAEYMANFFSEKGKKAIAIHSNNSKNQKTINRDEAISKLEENKIDIIFVVDIFNEGVDIPSIDTILLLRPTESYTVFLQQLGRGLRKFKDKEHLKVLDFIGNFKKAHYIPLLLSGKNPLREKKQIYKNPNDIEYPEGCNVNFDFKLIDLFEEMRKNNPIEVRKKEDYFRLKESLGRRPSRVELYYGSDISIREYLKKGYLNFLKEVNDLYKEEEKIIGTVGEEFLRKIEKTSMSKSYKIPTLLTFINGEDFKPKVSFREIAESFKNYYVDHKEHQKDLNNKSNKNWEKWDIKDFQKLAVNNPVKFLSKTDFFKKDEINKEFLIDEKIHCYLDEIFKIHFSDIVKLNEIKYFSRKFKGE